MRESVSESVRQEASPSSAGTSSKSSPGVSVNIPGSTPEESSQQPAVELNVNKQKKQVEVVKTELLKIRDVLVENRKALIGLTDSTSIPLHRRFEENLDVLNKQVGLICELLAHHFQTMQNEVPATYASALKKQSKAVE